MWPDFKWSRDHQAIMSHGYISLRQVTQPMWGKNGPEWYFDRELPSLCGARMSSLYVMLGSIKPLMLECLRHTS